MPPRVDKELLDALLEAKRCLCYRDLREGSDEEARIKSLLKEMETASEIFKVVHKVEAPISRIIDKTKEFDSTNKNLSRDIKQIEVDLGDLDKRIKELDSKIEGYPNAEEIKNWHIDKKTYEDLRDHNQQKVGNLKLRIQDLDKEIESLEKRLTDEINKESKLKHLMHVIDFTSHANSIASRSKTKILEGIRREIEKCTSEKLLKLMWKKNTYKKVLIDEQYDFHVQHILGYECLGSMSGGERECLALSFTFALHEVSGFEAPIIVDRPLAMASGDPVQYIAQAFTEISHDKQVILLCTPNDYTKEFSNLIDQVAIKRINMNLSSDEREVRLEVL